MTEQECENCARLVMRGSMLEALAEDLYRALADEGEKPGNTLESANALALARYWEWRWSEREVAS